MTTETDRLPLSFKDCDGNTMYRNDLGRYHYHNVLGGCAKHCLWTFEWCRKNIGPLTDFEYDEPAPEPTPRIPDEFICRSCDDSDEAFCYQHRYASLYAQFRKFWNEYSATGEIPEWAREPAPEPMRDCGYNGHEPNSCETPWHVHTPAPEPTARKAEKGDRVRVTPPTYEGVVHEVNPNGTCTVIPEDWQKAGGGDVWVPFDAEITVIERAAPKVPEEPPVGAVRMTDDPGVTFVHRYDEMCGWVTTNGSAKYSWDELRRDFGPLYTVERGAVVGGE